MAKREKYGPDVELATDDEMLMVLEVFDTDAEGEAEDDDMSEGMSEDEIEGIVGQAIDDAGR
jgi:hypothetical protein